MRVVFTIWNDRIAPVFDVAGQALIVVAEHGAVVAEQTLVLPAGSALAKVDFLAEAGTNILICGAISRPACFAAKGCGIEVHSFIAGTVREVIEAWFNGRLADSVFAMPGCSRVQACRRRRALDREPEFE